MKTRSFKMLALALLAGVFVMMNKFPGASAHEGHKSRAGQGSFAVESDATLLGLERGLQVRAHRNEHHRHAVRLVPAPGQHRLHTR
jgi:hypothetical protein